MKFISLFSGIGGFDLGFERAGMECVAQVEFDKRAREVLRKHWPDVALHEDVRNVGKHNLPTVDLVCGGFPCQDVSLAGYQLGLRGQRSTLWSEFARIICEIKPRWVVVENVVGLFSSDNGRFFGNILRDLAACGYDAEWDVLPAAAFGAPHLRPRVILVAYPNSAISSQRIFTWDSFQKEEWRSLSQEWSKDRVVIEVGTPVTRRISSYSQWIPEPTLARMVNGVPVELEQIKQLGNAIVPIVAEWVGKRIQSLSAVSITGIPVASNLWEAA